MDEIKLHLGSMEEAQRKGTTIFVRVDTLHIKSRFRSLKANRILVSSLHILQPR
jgi:hypothetical protein